MIELKQDLYELLSKPAFNLDQGTNTQAPLFPIIIRSGYLDEYLSIEAPVYQTSSR